MDASIALLEYASSIAECIPMPLCLIDKRGFIQYANDEIRDIINIPISKDFPYVGRFLESHSATRFRYAIEALSVSDTKISSAFNCVWSSEVMIDPLANGAYKWVVIGSRFNELYVLSGT
jgi:hypothetical protein